jgi:DNA repair protein RadD
MELRPYQQEAVDSVYDHLRTRSDNPCIVLPTAAGKSLVSAQMATDVVTRWNGRVLILAHVKELLEQNASKVRALCPHLDVGVYSAGLNSRDTDHAVIVAGIQSVYKRACELGRFDIVIVDEAHLIPPDGEGMYRQFFADAMVVNPHMRVVGMTATAYRLKGGTICQPENILNHICYEKGVKEMIAEGWICPLKSKGGIAKANLDNLHKRAGEFISTEVEEAMDRPSLVKAACAEIVELTRDRKSVLVFTAGVEHCEHVAAELAKQSGDVVEIVTGKTPSGERAEIYARFRGEHVAADLLGGVKPVVKYLVNVKVATTGLDVPNIDCVVILTSTASAGLYVQIVGRVFRLSPETGKIDGLVLDYGGNVLRHGPVDDIKLSDSNGGKGGGEAPAKECEQCHALVHAGYTVCPECGAEFPRPKAEATHDANASSEGIISGEVTDTDYEVSRTDYRLWEKKDRKTGELLSRTLRIDYTIDSGMGGFFSLTKSEWACPEHKGYAKGKFDAWWCKRSSEAIPTNVEDALEIAQNGGLAETKAITVRTVAGEKFDSIVAHVVGDLPPRSDGSEERDNSYIAAPVVAEVDPSNPPLTVDEIPF